MSACASRVTGAPQPDIVPGTAQADLLTIDEVSSVIGTTLTSSDNAGEPPAPLSADPPTCATAVGPGTRAVYTPGYTAYAAKTAEDGTSAHLVIQVVGVYSDPAAANAVFTALAAGIQGCPAAVRTDDDGTTKWLYTVDTAQPATLSWRATEDAGDGWVCSRQARLVTKTVLQVAFCEAADGRAATTMLADKISARIGK
ncbi:sensor domain-containing protein [Nocardia sp. alder85J]|uniref:sensor domain-containing protein n=1 Tax=Nocardia sp. alder85J TaxID=2862949 RepID=UPI001CD2B446|nr:sensor domain-containing protein [Nocardia sp. alder85J]MCX4095182.1 sensor domain-containing protein [Nocardia sp. alder85J]